MREDYKDIHDFLLDESFANWVLQGKDKAGWQIWLKQHPGKEALAQEAAEVLKQLSVTEHIPAAQTATAEEKLMQAIARPASKKMYKKWLAVAATVVLILGGSFYYFLVHQPVKLQTAYGETLKQLLPDGSDIILNTNSTIAMQQGFATYRSREVWLTGEANFHVKHTPQKQNFVVHTNRFDVVVTGTRFNVMNTDSISNVVLQEGSIIIKREGYAPVYMKPGDYVEYKNGELVKQQVAVENITAWINNQLVFDQTPLKAVAQTIKRHYGMEVLLDDALNNETLSGVLPNDNLDVLLHALHEVMDLTITKTGNTIRITK